MKGYWTLHVAAAPLLTVTLLTWWKFYIISQDYMLGFKHLTLFKQLRESPSYEIHLTWCSMISSFALFTDLCSSVVFIYCPCSPLYLAPPTQTLKCSSASWTWRRFWNIDSAPLWTCFSSLQFYLNCGKETRRQAKEMIFN